MPEVTYASLGLGSNFPLIVVVQLFSAASWWYAIESIFSFFLDLLFLIANIRTAATAAASRSSKSPTIVPTAVLIVV